MDETTKVRKDALRNNGTTESRLDERKGLMGPWRRRRRLEGGVKVGVPVASLSYSRYSIDTLMYKWHRYLRGSDYTYLLDNCLASSVYLRNFECGLSSRGEAADCDGLPFACGSGGDLLRCDVGGEEEL